MVILCSYFQVIQKEVTSNGKDGNMPEKQSFKISSSAEPLDPHRPGVRWILTLCHSGRDRVPPDISASSCLRRVRLV